MTYKSKVIVGISCGDINGVGLEIVIKLFLDNNSFNGCILVLYAPQDVLEKYLILYPEYNGFSYNLIDTIEQADPDNLNIINLSNKIIDLKPGVSTRCGAEIAINSLDLAIEHLNTNIIDVLVTLPLNKKNISTVRNSFVGHTEYLSNKTNSCKSLMLLCNEKLRIATLTNHLPISAIAHSITKKKLQQKINTLIETLKIDFSIANPKVAVLGLNPHSGDSGLIGDEEKRIIIPVISRFVEKGSVIHGPYPADGFFGSNHYKDFDAILGMYHDQALIPFKLMSFGRGVNYTAGLPVVRVSPDHGVGYDIAGKNMANISSVNAAILLGIQLFKNRKNYFMRNRKK